MNVLDKLFGLFRKDVPQGIGAGHNGKAVGAESRHDMPLVPNGNEDIIAGYRFTATLQLRTPLRVLLEHNRLERISPEGPPMITSEMWQGIWVPELIPEFQFLSEGEQASSDIGPVPANGGDYLPFLMDFRTIMEGSETVEQKEVALRDLTKKTGPRGTRYAKFWTATALVEQALPRVVQMLPVPATVRAALLGAGFVTFSKIARAPNEELLKLKGVGPKTLETICQFMRNTTIDPQARRVVAPKLR